MPTFPQQPSAVGAPDVANRDRIVGAQTGLDQILPLLQLLAQYLPNMNGAPTRGTTTSQQVGPYQGMVASPEMMQGIPGAQPQLREKMLK